MNKTYTPSEIARFVDVYASSVNNWIRKGMLKAYSTPGGHHRVVREDLISFLREQRMPVPTELEEGAVAVEEKAKRVLIVDDEPGMLLMLEHAFSIHPGVFAWDSRPNGYAALLRIGQHKPALIVVDLLMPEMDGWAVIDHLKASPETRDIRIVVISGQKPVPTQEQLAAHKVDAFFEKPFDTDAFLNTAARLLDVKLPDLSR